MNVELIDSSKGSPITIDRGLAILNLNSYITSLSKEINNSQIYSSIKNVSAVNFCNLASLCAKLKLEYGSRDCLELLQNIKVNLKTINSKIIFVQNKITQFHETDVEPFVKLYDFNKESCWILRYLKDPLINLLGFTNTQLYALLRERTFIQKVPSEILQFLQLQNEEGLYKLQKVRSVLL